MNTIGILLVHGVGEQRHYQHLSGEVRQIVQCLRELESVEDVSVTIRTSANAAYLAETVTVNAEDGAPVTVQFRHADQPQTWEFREVWWADLDERSTLWSQVKFWFWGFAQWAVDSYNTNKKKLDGFKQMELPSPPDGGHGFLDWLIIRTKLFLVGVVFCLVMLTLSFINFVLSRFLKGRIPGPDVVSSFVGDVKLLLQEVREGGGTISDLGLPPRVSIRRRMIKALVDMAMADYDRYYVAAHSLGTVIAFNGLMETELALPNYLDEATWDDCVRKGLGGSKEGASAGKRMMPRRPLWLEPDQVIFRDRLFARLEGFLTYGSPLDKFSALWGSIVGINKQPAFAPDFEWINVFDETDSVSGALDDFDNLADPGQNGDRIHAEPKNFAFSAFAGLLISHLKYLSYKPNDPERLVNRLCRWFIDGGSFPAPDSGTSGWNIGKARPGRYAFHLVQWVIVGVLLSFLLGWVLGKLSKIVPGSLDQLFDWMYQVGQGLVQTVIGPSLPNLQAFFSWSIVGLVVALAVVVVAGILRMLGLHNAAKLLP